MTDWIRIRGARQHNLKGVDVDIPRGRLTVVSGVSGSGKSSLVFDTLYADGQRSYVEALSAYARQFLARMPKPDVDHIEGISPAVAIQQRNEARSGRSTVGTVTEINDYLRVLFARIGRIVCPDCHQRVSADSPASAWRQVRRVFANGSTVLVAYPLPAEATARPGWAAALLAQGYRRIVADGRLVRLDGTETPPGRKADVVVDRIRLTTAARSRFAEAVELALRESDGWAVVYDDELTEHLRFSARLVCNGCGREFPPPTPHLFSFNSPHGACPDCNGFGNRLAFDELLIVPDDRLSLQDGALRPWRTETFSHAQVALLKFCRREGIPVDIPWRRLREDQRRQVLETERPGYTGVVPFLERMRREMKRAHHRFFTRRFMADTVCPTCRGTRLRPEALAVRVGGLDLGTLGRLSLEAARQRLGRLRLSRGDRALAGEVLDEILHRLDFLLQVGLGYLTLDRLARTLSGGEAQRIHLANALGSRLVDTLYILDEPTTGLHTVDVDRLLASLQGLVAAGNTVVVVEHDLSVLRRGDHAIELGPGAGRNGGRIVYQGPVARWHHGDTITARWLRGDAHLDDCHRPRPPARRELIVKGARHHNLRGIDVRIPLQRFVCLTGVSGSGKSTLLNDVLHDGLTGRVSGGTGRTHRFTGFQGAHHIDRVLRVDQSPIGRSSRSNPATYLGVMASIRELFARTPEARARGYAAGRFSFNTAGGRCPACQGLGEHRVEMHFLADISVLCEVCGGSRFSPQTLEVRFRGRNIAEVLALTVDEALGFFRGHGNVTEALWLLRKVGLGYLTLGQSATTLSGGESQRLKIARELAKGGGAHTLYLLDEPTTGLHAADVAVLVKVLHDLVERGHTVLVIEHNLELIAQADWVIDLGPGGGDRGGTVVATGTPGEIAATADSPTGRALATRAAAAVSGKEQR